MNNNVFTGRLNISFASKQKISVLPKVIKAYIYKNNKKHLVNPKI